jgi:hypothetical protein
MSLHYQPTSITQDRCQIVTIPSPFQVHFSIGALEYSKELGLEAEGIKWETLVAKIASNIYTNNPVFTRTALLPTFLSLNTWYAVLSDLHVSLP